MLGVSVRDAKRAEYFYRRFLSYMEERHGLCTGREERREKWLMPRIPPGCPHLLGTGTRFVRGRSGGVSEPDGEGVSAALESGHHAAGALMEHWNEPERALRATGNGRAPCGLTCGVNGVLPQAWRRRSGR